MTPADDLLSEYWEWKTPKNGDPMVGEGDQMMEQISPGLIKLDPLAFCIAHPTLPLVLFGPRFLCSWEVLPSLAWSRSEATN